MPIPCHPPFAIRVHVCVSPPVGQDLIHRVFVEHTSPLCISDRICASGYSNVARLHLYMFAYVNSSRKVQPRTRTNWFRAYVAKQVMHLTWDNRQGQVS